MVDMEIYRMVKDESRNEVNSNESLEDMLRSYLKDFIIEDDNAVGFTTDLSIFHQIVEKMKTKGFAFSIRDSDVRLKRKKLTDNMDIGAITIQDSPEQHSFFYQLKVMPIKFFGLPFRVEKTTHYHCAYGCKYYKSRAETTKTDNLIKQANNKYKRKRNIGSKKMGCIAKMTLKSIIVYPGYKLETETDWRMKKKLIERLRRDLTESDKLVSSFQRFYISVSLQSSHNHPPMVILPKSIKTKKLKTQTSMSSLKLKRARKLWRESSEDLHDDTGGGNDWELELASTSIQSEREQQVESTTTTTRVLSLQDEPFFHTLVKYPSQPTTTTHYQASEYKPVSIEFQIPEYETSERTTVHVQSFDYQSTIYDVQLMFRDKLKKLYTLSESCVNASLLLKLTNELEQMESILTNDVSSYTSYEQ